MDSWIYEFGVYEKDLERWWGVYVVFVSSIFFLKLSLKFNLV